MEKAGVLKTYLSQEIQTSAVGIGFETLDRELFKPEKCYHLLGQSGVKYARCQTGWARCETKKGVYDFLWLDAVVDKLMSQGLNVWFNVGYGNPLYMENIPNKTGVGCVPLFYGDECLDAWKNYISALAEHFAGRVSLFEIWNEPETDHFWHPCKPDPNEYARLYRITASEIKKHIPDAKIAATVASGFDFGYMRGMFAALRGEQMDFFCYHAHSKQPEISFGFNHPYLENVALVRKLLDDSGFKATRLIQGEAGHPSWAPKGHWLYKDGFDNPRAQAIWLLRRFVLDHYAGVEISSFFMIADIWEKPYEKATETIPRAQANGILNGLVYTPKLSYTAIQHIASLFSGTVKPLNAYFAGNSQVPLSRFSFEKNGSLMYIYYTPVSCEEELYTENGFCAYTETPLDEPVLINMLTGEVYNINVTGTENGLVAYERLPVSNYPMVLTEKKAIAMV